MHCTINPSLLCQRYITASMTNYTTNDAFIHQCCITLSRMSYIIIVELHHYAPLHHQHCFRPAVLLIFSTVLKMTVMLAELNHRMQSYIIKFCPTKNSIHFEVPRHEFETLRWKRYWKSEANIQKSSAKTLFWKPSQNSHFSGKLHKFH